LGDTGLEGRIILRLRKEREGNSQNTGLKCLKTISKIVKN
jgi:hypothetical protein